MNYVTTLGLPFFVESELAIDPSGDNYNYYRDEYDALGYDIQDIKYNGQDGNSPTTDQSTVKIKAEVIRLQQPRCQMLKTSTRTII